MTALTIQELAKLRSDVTESDLEAAYNDALALLPLAALRKKSGTTQAEMASRLGKSQAAVSKFEGRGDFLLSTLYRHVKAIGGQLKIGIAAGNSRYELVPTDFDDEIGFCLSEQGLIGGCLADHARQFASTNIRRQARFGNTWKRDLRRNQEDMTLSRVLAEA